MSDKEILTRGLEKVINAGYRGFQDNLDEGVENYLEDNKYFAIIFHKSFAIGIWGREPIGEGCNDSELPEWKYRLMEMVIQDDPLRYLGNYV